MSLRKSAWKGAKSTVATAAPVRTLKPRTTSMSVAQSVSPISASPFGALSVTPSRPPAISSRESIFPSGFIREMKPLLSLASGLPLMFET